MTDQLPRPNAVRGRLKIPHAPILHAPGRKILFCAEEPVGVAKSKLFAARTDS